MVVSGLRQSQHILFHHSALMLMVIVWSWIQLAICACVSLCAAVHRLCGAGQLAKSYISPCPPLYVASTSAQCLGAYKIHTSLHPSALTSRACPHGAVRNMAPDRPVLHVGGFWFYYPGSAGKIQFSQEWLGILTHLSLICEQGSRSERSNTILLVEKFGKMRADGGKIRK